MNESKRLKKEVGVPGCPTWFPAVIALALAVAVGIPLGMMCLSDVRDYTPPSGAPTPTLEPIKVDGNTSLGDTATNLEPTRTTLGVGWIPYQDRVSTICNDYGEWIGCKASDCVYGWALRKKDGWSFACGRAEDIPAYCPGTDGGLARCDENEFPDRVPGYAYGYNSLGLVRGYIGGTTKFRNLIIGDGKGGVVWMSHEPFKVGTP